MHCSAEPASQGQAVRSRRRTAASNLAARGWVPGVGCCGREITKCRDGVGMQGWHAGGNMEVEADAHGESRGKAAQAWAPLAGLHA
jgi:hypothetical protein